ncbi:uncharacterized protein LOC143216208 [Lasioglossum baleicum]|uniref:uncharacterized protein LOC143216208 n=1 Tax=Lasioglossum baleicum TaxID=434251 RepID=UPI003FCCD176
MFAKSNFDPELEKLRNEVDGPPNLDTVALSIQRATCRIHASYLFEQVGRPTLQKLCLLLSSTATGKAYCGWQEFATHMGLTMEQIRCIDYDFKGQQDPTYYVLLAYVQDVGATIDKILSALQQMRRFDVINRIKDNISDLLDAIQQETPVSDSTILMTKSIPRAPMVLTPLESTQEMQTRALDSKQVSQNQTKKNKQLYGCRVMLTFAEDGLETAQYISKVFRSHEAKIGVLILQEHANHVYSRASQFIDDCFYQVKFIVPILTKGYLERIHSDTKIYSDDQSILDSKYIKYIYSLMTLDYMRYGCVNFRVRCIVPDKEIHTLLTANLHPTFQAWFKESSIDTFINNILLQKRSK